jgi:hypothetical protein
MANSNAMKEVRNMFVFEHQKTNIQGHGHQMLSTRMITSCLPHTASAREETKPQPQIPSAVALVRGQSKPGRVVIVIFPFQLTEMGFISGAGWDDITL